MSVKNKWRQKCATIAKIFRHFERHKIDEERKLERSPIFETEKKLIIRSVYVNFSRRNNKMRIF